MPTSRKRLSEEQQRRYAIKIFERDDKVMQKLGLTKETMSHIEADIEAAEKELDDDAESIITNERYIYIGEVIKRCYKKHSAGKLTTSDKIDKIVTNRWLGLPIFAVVMFLVYYIAMVGVGAGQTTACSATAGTCSASAPPITTKTLMRITRRP